jgi:flagellar hook-associated protein 1 FlgK
VNLDEEAANLLRYQQAYQAAAQVIAVTNTLFDTLLGAVRR